VAQVGRISGPLLQADLLRGGRDLAIETDLVYLSVDDPSIPSKIVGIGLKTSSPTHDLQVAGDTFSTNLIVDTQFTNNDITINTSDISTALGALNLIAVDRIDAVAVGTDSVKIDNNVISSYANSNIEIRPNGNGTLEIPTKLYVDGGISATGNVTFDGSITFGDANTDSVSFVADINSSIIPNFDNDVKLGDSNTTRWGTTSTRLVNGLNLVAGGLSTSEGINLALRQQNIWYVAKGGDDANEGDHPQGPFASVEQALSVAQPGDQIIIYPGEYEETFPLTIPQGVTVTGKDIRTVIIKPTLATQSNDAFKLNGESTVEDLTIKDFFTGHAFSFASNALIAERSPYIRNVTVLTRGSTTTSNDPRGYSAGDAGKGALVDGSVLNASTTYASMLFHSVTFITPGVDALTMTNGVRVEWLNSFTYFALRGLYLTNGTAGRSNDATTFGAELRSIGSANVYGHYGAVADGADTLGYLIGHNFAYIGSDGDERNDISLVNQANEYVELNSGTIYTNTVDQSGDFRIGNIFVVDQQTGIISFNAQSINISETGNIVLEQSGNRTYVDSHELSVDNIQISGNTISSLTGPVNFFANSGTTTWNTNVNVTGNMDVTGDVTFDGDITFGNEVTDTVTFAPNFTQTIEPEVDRAYDLGNKTDPKVWDTAFIKDLDVDAVIDITNNEITTLTSNTDLQFEADGTGIIHVTSTDVQINNNLTINADLTVNGDTAFRNTSITGDITQTGNINQTGNLDIIGNFETLDLDISGVGSYLDIPNVRIQNNVISATATDDDLVFTANGSGGVKLDSFLTITDTLIENTRISATTDDEKSIFLTPDGASDLDINTNTSLILPKGSEYDRILDTIGQIRYNSRSNNINGYQPSGDVSMIGLASSSELLYIPYPELVTNGTFDTDISGWTGSGSWDVTSGLRTANFFNTSQTFTVTPGAQHDYSIESVSRDPSLTQYLVEIIDGSTVVQSWDLGAITALMGGSFPTQSYTFTGSITPTNTTVTIRFSTVGGTALFDNVSFKRPGNYTEFTDSTVYVTPELTRGANDGVIRFSTNDAVQVTLDEDKIYTDVIEAGNLKIEGNTISSTVLNSDIEFSTQGIGTLNFSNAGINVVETTINNITNNALTFENTDNGYVKVVGTNGMVIPVGTDEDIGGSMYFDQSVNQYIGLVLGWELGTSEYSAECWFKMTSGTSGTLIGGSETNGFTLRINSLAGPNNVEVLALDGTSNTFTVNTISLNSWNHIVACRDSSGNETVFLNGVRASSQTTNTIDYSGSTQYIAKNENGDYFTGHIAGIRVQQDETKYDPTVSTYNVPIGPPKSNSFSRVVLIMLNEAYLIIDDSQQQEVTNYGSVSFSTDSPFSNTQPSNPEIGTTRLNVNTETIEVYNGTDWAPIYGSSESVTIPEVEDIADIWSLVVG
jgi:hypothetical protein